MDPATGTRIYCPILIWYASLKTKLSTYGMSPFLDLLVLY